MYPNPRIEEWDYLKEKMNSIVLVDLMVIDILDFVQFVVENLPKINH
jgi:hypothetical protein